LLSLPLPTIPALPTIQITITAAAVRKIIVVMPVLTL
jgi:hypothetical protein